MQIMYIWSNKKSAKYLKEGNKQASDLLEIS